jgi:hypothetical protein
MKPVDKFWPVRVIEVAVGHVAARPAVLAELAIDSGETACIALDPSDAWGFSEGLREACRLLHDPSAN